VPAWAEALAAGVSDPQAWNRYAYVLGNPTTFVDPLGLDRHQVGSVMVCTVTADGGGGGEYGNGGGGGGGGVGLDLGDCSESGTCGGGGGPAPQIPPRGPRIAALPRRRTQGVTAGCVFAELGHNIIGGEGQAGAFFALNIAAVVASGLVKTTVELALPGPGWLYVAVAGVYDAALVAEAIAACKYDAGASPN
jgi:hypothetical protein